MAITVNNNDNPTTTNAGKAESDAAVISSGFSSGTTEYQIRRKDQRRITMGGETAKANERNVLNVNSSIAAHVAATDVVVLNSSTLSIVLPFRTKMQVRVRNAGGAWSGWTNFKTRDKTYTTPDSINRTEDDSKDQVAVKGRQGKTTYTVTNSGKSSTVNTTRGATVTNTDTGYVNTTSIAYTSRGATIQNQ